MGRKLAPKAVPYEKADGSTSWRVRLRTNGRQTTETFPNEVAANVFISRMLDPAIGPERAVEMREREDTYSGGYIPTVREMLTRHVEDLTGVDERTREDYPAIAGRTWLPALGSYRVDEVTRSDIAKWLNATAGTVKPKTIGNAFSVLSATLNSAVSAGHITANPARGMRLPREGSEDAEDIKFLTHTEFDRLYAEFPVTERPIVTWMFGMGTRWGETTAGQRRDIDPDAGQMVGEEWIAGPTMRVVRAWKRGGRVGPPKSDAGRRTIVMPWEVFDIVELEIGREDWLFRTSTGRPVLHSNFFNRVWKPATMRASICPEHRLPGCRCFGGKPYLCTIHTDKDAQGNRVLPEPCGCPGTLPFRPRIHDARHTHASWLIARGVRLDVIQHRLGHDDYLTTQRLYGHLLPDAQVQASVAASLAFSLTSISSSRALAAGEPAALEPPTSGTMRR